MCSAREGAHLYLKSEKQPLLAIGLNAAGLITFFPIPPFLMPPPLYVFCITEDRNKEMLQSLLLFFLLHNPLVIAFSQEDMYQLELFVE